MRVHDIGSEQCDGKADGEHLESEFGFHGEERRGVGNAEWSVNR